MAIKSKNEGAYKLSPEETAAVKAGMTDFANGKSLTEEKFQKEMGRYLERRKSEINSVRSVR